MWNWAPGFGFGCLEPRSLSMWQEQCGVFLCGCPSPTCAGGADLLLCSNPTCSLTWLNFHLAWVIPHWIKLLLVLHSFLLHRVQTMWLLLNYFGSLTDLLCARSLSRVAAQECPLLQNLCDASKLLLECTGISAFPGKWDSFKILLTGIQGFSSKVMRI